MTGKTLPVAFCGACWFSSCAAPERSPSAFRLPEVDVEAGKAAFVEVKCKACHEVRRLPLPGPVAQRPVPVALGGTVDYQPTDGRFVTSIINPSHKLAPGISKGAREERGAFANADYSDAMTVRQLVDLVAFLHSRYEFVPRTVQH